MTVAKVTEKNMQSFAYNNILVQLGVLHSLVMDNGKQFNCKRMEDFCSRYKIIPYYTLVNHPQANGQAKVMDRTITESLKARVDRLNEKQANELPNILWVYQTIRRILTKETPFRFSFGFEAILIIKLGLLNIRVLSFNEMVNQMGIRALLDTMEETHDLIRKRIASYQQRATRYYDKKVKYKVFQPGDLVCRKLKAMKSEEG